MRRCLILAPLLLAACSEQTGFLPGKASFSPSALDFGVVSVTDARTLSFELINQGQTAYVLADIQVVDDPRGVWSVAVQPELRAGLGPGDRSRIDVTYRPCPEAWLGHQLDPNYDLARCPSAPDAADLVVTGGEGSAWLPITGTPGLPPVVELLCPRTVGADGCPGELYDAAPCTSLRFGTIGLGKSCEAEIEVVSRSRDGARTADLLLQDALLRVRALGTDTPYTGAEAGFELLDEAGQAIAPTADAPIVVSIPEGAAEGRLRMKVRYTTALDGVLAGDSARGDGLKLVTNVAAQPEVGASLYATGALPMITRDPGGSSLVLAPQVGQEARATVTLFNRGPGHATIESVALVPSHPELRLEPSLDGVALIEGESRSFEVVYTRRGEALASSAIVFRMASPVVGPVTLELNPDANADACEVTPELLDFGFTMGGVLTANVTVRATGPTGCTVRELDISAPNPTAATEFSVDLPGCSSLPCDPGITLCADAGCAGTEVQIPLRYQNTDLTVTDLAELHLRTSDRINPERLVVLQAYDSPCFPPIPAITVLTAEPCAGQEVRLTAASSAPGGYMSGPATVVDWEWAVVFGAGNPEFIPPNAVTTSFVPEGGGVMSVSLAVTNSCGARSVSAAVETIFVAPSCP